MSYARAFLTLLKPYFWSKGKGLAWALLITVLTLDVVHVGFLVKLNKWSAVLYDTLEKKDMQLLWLQVIVFFKLLAFLIPTGIASLMCKALIAFHWRRALTTHYAEKMMQHERYYGLSLGIGAIENPDQRITEDLNNFPTRTIAFVLGSFTSILTLISFLGVLWSLSPHFTFHITGTAYTIHGYLVWVALLYALFGTGIIAFIGRQLIPLNFRREKYEANFRFALVRLRERREEIALFRGGMYEQQLLEGKFSDITRNFYQLLRQEVYVNLSTNLYVNMDTLVPVFAAAPLLVAGAITLGVLMQIHGAFSKVVDAASLIIAQLDNIMNWVAEMQRIREFDERLENIANQTLPFQYQHHRENSLILEDCSIHDSQGHSIIGPVSLTIAPREKLLMMGPSGIGKTSITRVLAGIWPYGEGSITLPTNGMFFLPQRPYMPLGVLKDCITYPSLGDFPVDMQQLHQDMTTLGLTHLIPLLGEKRDWQAILSQGEQQRIHILRALVREPSLLIMDEPTSGMNVELEAIVFKLLQERLPNTTLLTIGHAPTLTEYHDRVWMLQAA